MNSLDTSKTNQECQTANTHELSFLKQFQGICIIPKSVVNQEICANEKCQKAVDDELFDYKWYNKETQQFTCQPCGSEATCQTLQKCLKQSECPVCLNQINDLALLPCGHGKIQMSILGIGPQCLAKSLALKYECVLCRSALINHVRALCKFLIDSYSCE